MAGFLFYDPTASGVMPGESGGVASTYKTPEQVQAEANAADFRFYQTGPTGAPVKPQVVASWKTPEMLAKERSTLLALGLLVAYCLFKKS